MASRYHSTDFTVVSVGRCFLSRVLVLRRMSPTADLSSHPILAHLTVHRSPRFTMVARSRQGSFSGRFSPSSRYDRRRSFPGPCAVRSSVSCCSLEWDRWSWKYDLGDGAPAIANGG